jgi:hypothetical protein
MQQGIVTCLRCVGISMHIWTPKLRSHQLRFSPSLAHFQADSIHHYYGLVLIHILDKGKEQAQTRLRAISIRGVPVISSQNSHASTGLLFSFFGPSNRTISFTSWVSRESMRKWYIPGRFQCKAGTWLVYVDLMIPFVAIIVRLLQS